MEAVRSTKLNSKWQPVGHLECEFEKKYSCTTTHRVLRNFKVLWESVKKCGSSSIHKLWSTKFANRKTKMVASWSSWMWRQKEKSHITTTVIVLFITVPYESVKKCGMPNKIKSKMAASQPSWMWRHNKSLAQLILMYFIIEKFHEDRWRNVEVVWFTKFLNRKCKMVTSQQ